MEARWSAETLVCALTVTWSILIWRQCVLLGSNTNLCWDVFHIFPLLSLSAIRFYFAGRKQTLWPLWWRQRFIQDSLHEMFLHFKWKSRYLSAMQVLSSGCGRVVFLGNSQSCWLTAPSPWANTCLWANKTQVTSCRSCGSDTVCHLSSSLSRRSCQ